MKTVAAVDVVAVETDRENIGEKDVGQQAAGAVFVHDFCQYLVVLSDIVVELFSAPADLAVAVVDGVGLQV